MQFIKKSAIGASASLLLILLIIFGIAFGVQRVFSTPTAIKSAFKESDFYQNVIASALDQAQKGEQYKAQSGQNDIPIDRPEIQSIIQNAVSPEFLQTQTESVLDSVYAWLRGQTPQLSFKIDLADAKTRLADGIEQYTAQHLATLPACQAGVAPSSDVDPFNATCLPKGASAAQVASEAKNQILNGEFLKDSQLTADSIKTGQGDKTLAQQLEGVPANYQKLNWVLYGVGLLILLLSLAIVFLSISRRSGLKKLSILAITAGLIVAAVTWLSNFGLQQAGEALKEPLQQSIVKVAQILAGDLRGWWAGYGIPLTILGIGTLLALHFVKPNQVTEHQKAGTPADEPAQIPSSAKLATDAQTQSPKPKPIKKLIQ